MRALRKHFAELWLSYASDVIWQRKKGEKFWAEVKGLAGNLDPQKTER
jgi:hypothetical protein